MFGRQKKNNSSFLYWSESDNEVEPKPKPEQRPAEPEEPIIETIEKKWASFTGEFKSMMDSFTTSLSKTFSSDNVPPPPPPPQSSQNYPSNYQKEDIDLSSSDDEEELEPLMKLEERTPASVK